MVPKVPCIYEKYICNCTVLYLVRAETRVGDGLVKDNPRAHHSPGLLVVRPNSFREPFTFRERCFWVTWTCHLAGLVAGDSLVLILVLEGTNANRN